MSSIKFRGADIPIRITYKMAMFDFPEMGLHLLKVFQDGETLTKVLTDDELMLNVWFYYVKNHTTTLEDAVSDLTPEMMHEFRDIFWAAILNFTNPQMRPALMEFKKMVIEQLASPAENLKKHSLESLPEQELTPISSPSDKSST